MDDYLVVDEIDNANQTTSTLALMLDFTTTMEHPTITPSLILEVVHDAYIVQPSIVVI